MDELAPSVVSIGWPERPLNKRGTAADKSNDAGIAQRVMKLSHFETKALMRDHHETTRYAIELDMLERDATRGNAAAVELLRSEFALALNASYFTALSGGDIEVGAIWRSRPQEGVARYAVELLLEERTPAMSDEHVAELLRREFARAQNASHFIRIAAEDFSPKLAARGTARTTPASLRAA